MSKFTMPHNYDPKTEVRRVEQAVKFVKDTFERDLARELNLERVSAPLFVRPETGLNDDLNGVERAVSFDIPDAGVSASIVHSLAKWKRMALKEYGFKPGEGLYTDMNAIRRDEELDNLHSIYVDQWDWEKIITKETRTPDTLRETVEGIYGAILKTNSALRSAFAEFSTKLPESISFITTLELESRYPNLTPKERENEIARSEGAVFVMQIGDVLKDGNPHDGRAPDYDDWSMNGDIIVWYDVLGCALELSSMGIRVDELSMRSQLAKAGKNDRLELPFHSMLTRGELPLTIGGGIGQSRLCMLLLRRAHIGEVQSSIWSDEILKQCLQNSIRLL